MADQNNSSQNVNSFVKGMTKDVVDIHTPESVWKNAVNVINNSHLGDLGSIGNEQANTRCASAPYTIIGIIHKVNTEWVVFSTNNTDSEIGVFNDTEECKYIKIVNDPCLNFSTFNLITGAVKENYDCTFSVYWQDNLNPDRVLNLNRVPYICTDKLIEVTKVYKEYTIARDLGANPCGVSTASIGGAGAHTETHSLGETFGVVNIRYCTYAFRDKIDVYFEGNLVASTNGFVEVGQGDSGNPYGVCDTCRCRTYEAGILTFNKNTTTSTCTVVITPDPKHESSTQWDYIVDCPVRDANTPPQPVIKTGIYYINKYDQTVELEPLGYGQSIPVCALEDSIVSNDFTGYTVTPVAIAPCLTKKEMVPDPNACGEQDCTNRLDCDHLRLHPFVEQPCIIVSKSKGSGQLNNGSYQAVIAMSENGIKLTDYSMPSNPQSLWDHTGVGGSINIDITQLDQNFTEFELVVIAVVNQQTIAKKVGYYSIDQTHIHLDILNTSLITVDLATIPLKTVVYEKSEKMFDISGYLLRSSVTTQPFFNYQPLANQIKAEWQAVEYAAAYYWNGGNQVGYMRDEVYSFFIRWVYKTGARSASFHIPGREAINTDTELVPLSDDVIDISRRQKWQVYDTSTVNTVSEPLYTVDGGKVVSRGELAYWESSEKYPNNHREIWGDLCFRPIRHHKMPSNETIHIHDPAGKSIFVLGVNFYNIKHPIDVNGNPITDIVGYEILRGSREGNRSILAKGLFNNMVEYKIRGNNEVKGLFENYPYNDVDNFDPFLTEANELVVKPNILSFHAPENNLIKPYVGSGAYIKLYTEEIGKASIKGEYPYKHPKFKFINTRGFDAALVVAFGIGLISLFGKQSTSSTTTGHTSVPITGELNKVISPWVVEGLLTEIGGTNEFESWGEMKNPLENYDASTTTASEGGTASAASGFIDGAVVKGIIAGFSGLAGAGSIISALVDLISLITTAYITFYQAFDSAIDIIYHFIKFRDYVVQLNSHGFYKSFTAITSATSPSGTKASYTRKVTDTKLKYVDLGLQDFDGSYRINNLNRNKFLVLQTNKDIPFTTAKDNSKELLPDTAHPVTASYDKDIASYYGALKYDFENQYGQLQAITQIPTASCVYPALLLNGIYHTPVIFGGDVYINRYTEKNPFYFFHTWLYDTPNGEEFVYRDYENGPEPTYWLDSTRYDASMFGITISLKKLDFDGPEELYKLHTTEDDVQCGFSVCRSVMYLSNNSVRDFFTESELNVAFRDYGEDPWEKFFDPVGNSFSDLHMMFRSDYIKIPIYYKYDLSLSASKLYSNFASWSNILPRDYDPLIYTSCFQYYPKRIVYSLQQQSGLKRDNWRNYLQFNYKDWNDKVNSIKTLNAQGAIILFENSEPMQFVGVDTMQSAAGVKFTLGDAGLFMQNMQSIVNADDAFAYGSSISSRAAVNTPYGLFWISQKTGKVCSFNGSGIDEISNKGMKHWFLENLPSPLLAVYPEFPLYDNVLEGISCQAIFDSQYELVYFTKKDYKPRPEFADIKDKLIYVNGEGFYIDAGDSTTTPGTSTKSCPPGYTLSTDGTQCTRVVTTPICPAGSTYNPIDDTCSGFPGVPKPCLVDIIFIYSNSYNTIAATDHPAIVAFYSAIINGLGPKLDDGSVSIGIHYITTCGNELTTSMGSNKTILLDAITHFSTPNGSNNILNGLDKAYGALDVNSRTRVGAKKYIILAINLNATTTTYDCHPVYATQTSTSNVFTAGQELLDFGADLKYIKNVEIIQAIFGSGACGRELALEYTADLYDNRGACDSAGVYASWMPPVGFSGNHLPSLGTGINGLALYDMTPANGTIIANNILADMHCTTTTIPVPTAPCVSPCTKNDTAGTCSCTETVSPLTTTTPGEIIKKLTKIDIKDYLDEYFWTASYDPKIKAWISFHDWHPSFLIPSYNHFLTIKGSTFWRHNTTVTDYCNYYDIAYPWEIEYPIITPSEITTLRSIEYNMQGQYYYNEGKDFHHALDANFDRAIIYNSEQISGILKLNLKSKTNPVSMLQYPILGNNGIDILYSKEENKFRFNQFYDITNDRGEFLNAQGVLDTTQMWDTRLDGHTKFIRPSYIDYNKKPLEHKKFRHYGNYIILRKNYSGNLKMILKLTYSKHLNSPR